jgi:ABC-type antimicrobial peptide transport system permease subunit
MFDLLEGLISLLSTSVGVIAGCVLGLFVSYAVYYSLDGRDFQVHLSALAFLTSVILCIAIEASLEKQK